MKTILELINLGEEYLKQKGVEKARREAEELIACALMFRRIDLYLNFERPLIEEELEKCRLFFKRRGKREPSQYIAGEVSFAGVQIKVAPTVLIPRQETEILVEKIASELKALPSLEGKVLWDMCTGSGCIGIALKKRFPDLTVILSDISPHALKTASQNALLNNVDVKILEGDLFAPYKEGKIDFFISNPPYVSEGEYVDLSPEVRNFEPKGALVGGKNGLFFYEKIAQELFDRLKECGKGWLEIGKDQKNAVLNLFQNNQWSKAFVEQDWSGNDRFLFLEKD